MKRCSSLQLGGKADHRPGGIIALGLAMAQENLSAEQMVQKFRTLAEATFKLDRRGHLSLMDPLAVVPKVFMFTKLWTSRYRSSNLRNGLIELFGESQTMFSSAMTTHRQRRVRVAVTCTSSGQPCIFSNYSKTIRTSDQTVDANDLGTNGDLEREDDPLEEAKVWEA